MEIKRNWESVEFKEKFIQLVKESFSLSDVVNRIYLKSHSGNFLTIKKYFKLWNIDTSHFYRKTTKRSIHSNEDLFTENSFSTNGKLRREILKNKLIEYKCQECNQDDVFNGKKLVLQLDHKNGIKQDNRLSNLRFLCPNCHSQTPTYGSKNVRKTEIDFFKIIDLYLKNHNKIETSKNLSIPVTHVNRALNENPLLFQTELNKRTASFLNTLPNEKNLKSIEKKSELSYKFIDKKTITKNKFLKIEKIKNRTMPEEKLKEKEDLQILVDKFPLIKIGKILGISDVAVKKRCIRMGIKLKRKGFWTKQFYKKEKKPMELLEGI